MIFSNFEVFSEFMNCIKRLIKTLNCDSKLCRIEIRDMLLLRNLQLQMIGTLEFGGDNCFGSALEHWNEMLNSASVEIKKWHKLCEPQQKLTTPRRK